MHKLVAAALLAACCAAQAQTTPPEVAAHQRQELKRGDPARWYKTDRTTAAQLRTLRKEINAAYAEAKIACRKMTADERSDCMKEARDNYTADLGNLRELNYAANHMDTSVYETTGR
jgi:membrane-bound lytic murein transglycosylase B